MADGHREVIAVCVVALPGEEHAQIAEAWGCRAGLFLLRTAAQHSGTATITGDNLMVVRRGAAQGGVRKCETGLVLDRELARVAHVGTELRWRAVRRRHNKEADAVATRALEHAAALQRRGCREAVLWIEHRTGG